MTIIETIKIRKSCRTYSDKVIEPEKMAELRQFLASSTKAPFGSNVRFHLMDFNEMHTGELKNLTTYGVIKGARQFIVFHLYLKRTPERAWVDRRLERQQSSNQKVWNIL